VPADTASPPGCDDPGLTAFIFAGSDAGLDLTGDTEPVQRFRRLIVALAAVVAPDRTGLDPMPVSLRLTVVNNRQAAARTSPACNTVTAKCLK
jgi:hypothetical protein